jgi:hypothetical protein
VETNFNTSSWKGQAIGSLARAAQATLWDPVSKKKKFQLDTD